ncbi:MAG: hypothetical protein CMM30_07905 [Rhodospirillaceae bacterium]|nr:hypothetical protein [Rhodospirillaceae bacterium]
MDLQIDAPRILLISQFPKVLNGEYELIEKIKHTGYKITVVDYLGFDIDTGVCLDSATLSQDYDFAISFHFDTPTYVNTPTFLYVANPIEFMHLRGDYRDFLIGNLRGYDGYLLNRSDVLIQHIKKLVGDDQIKYDMEMFPSISSKVIRSPDFDNASESYGNGRIFYCGVNWERGLDQEGRSQGLLSMLQDKNLADFYGPTELDGVDTWAGFTSYRGEIPFDGISMLEKMSEYSAILAVSSPAHLRSRTSSSRVFEGVSSGVPVISDNNPHVRKLFGDSVYYFEGEDDQSRLASIDEILSNILQNPAEAIAKVQSAQKLIKDNYSFETSFHTITKSIKIVEESDSNMFESDFDTPTLDIFLFHHDHGAKSYCKEEQFSNLPYVIVAAEQAADRFKIPVQIILVDDYEEKLQNHEFSGMVSMIRKKTEEVVTGKWDKFTLGEKISSLNKKSESDYKIFLTQFDYIDHDHLTNAIRWYGEEPQRFIDGNVYVSGFFVSDMTMDADPIRDRMIIRNNRSNGLYQWSQNSIAEHELSCFVFTKNSSSLLTEELCARYDVMLPIVMILKAQELGYEIHRSRFISARILVGSFHRHFEAYQEALSKGFWAQHYELVSNYTHELNAMYDDFIDSYPCIEAVDKVAGRIVSTRSSEEVIVDPAIKRVNEFIDQIRPLYRLYVRVKKLFKL